jgi:hypothetical protein
MIEIIAFAAMFISCLGYLLARVLLITHVSHHYPELYDAAGRPWGLGRSNLFLSQFMAYAAKVPGDHEFKTLLAWTQSLLFTQLFCFFVFFIAFIAEMWAY